MQVKGDCHQEDHVSAVTAEDRAEGNMIVTYQQGFVSVCLLNGDSWHTSWSKLFGGNSVRVFGIHYVCVDEIQGAT